MFDMPDMHSIDFCKPAKKQILPEDDAFELMKEPLKVCPLPRIIPKLNPMKGTTTLGFKFKHGVVLAVDSRASMSEYIASQKVMKVIAANEYLLGTMAGGAADCQYWHHVIGKEARLWELRNKSRITVAAASKIFGNILYSYRNHGLSVGSMMAGWDQRGPQLYYLDNSGQRTMGDMFSVGSGSVNAYGVLDVHYKYDMECEEAYELARRAIWSATSRDSYSGGTISVFQIHEPDAEGRAWKKVSTNDQNEYYDVLRAAGKTAVRAQG